MTRKPMLLRLGPGTLAALLACGCGDSPSGPSPMPPEPTSPPTTENSVPVLFVRGGDQSCHPEVTPSGAKPCLLRLTAYASDADRDPLTYAWSGCATGGNPGADCVVSAVRAFVATVRVSDGRGGVVTGSVEVHGVNRAPAISLPGAPEYLPAATHVELYGELDDDDDVSADSLFMDMDAAGSCGPYVRHERRGGPNVVMINFTTHTPGVCELSVRLRDAWGRTSVTPLRFEVEQR